MIRIAKSTGKRPTPAVVTPPLDPLPPHEPNPPRVVAIGTSAGGLEALGQFLAQVPATCGCAFVIIQHLDPHHVGMLSELLQRTTTMTVAQITDGMRVMADHVYVIPPNRDVSLTHGVLHLLELSKARGVHLPIDAFFRSLADDQRERSIGVILSGMGSDGTLGIRAIKERAGAIFVQSPESAKYDSMPRSAIDSGLVDVVAPAEALAEKILVYLRQDPLFAPRAIANRDDRDRSGLDQVILHLRSRTGHDFSLYKKSTLHRRIERRMALHQLGGIAAYARFLRDNAQEADLLFKELLIGVTGFFRDPATWEQLGTEIIPALLAAHPNGGRLRAWVPACSTGEEAYTLAMIFREALECAKPTVPYLLQVFATDLDHDAIDRARSGFYPSTIKAEVSPARLQRFFVADGSGYRVSKEIREMVIFAPQNLVMDPPFTKLDLVTCRNLLIYLEADLQKKLMPLFHYSLNPGGALLLGNSETIGSATHLFTPLPGNHRIYRRHDALLRCDRLEFSPKPIHHQESSSATGPLQAIQAMSFNPNLQALTEALILQRFAPAAVLTTVTGDIVFISGRTGAYLEPACGKANLNIFAMARVGLDSALGELFVRAVRESATLTLKSVTVGTNGSTRMIDVTVQPLREPAALQDMVLVVFTDVATPVHLKGASKSARTNTLNARIAELSQELQTSREERQNSQEELTSTNEELQSTNEEMQSTNEELTTSKEEMQSMNEELQTVNQELQSKINELTWASDDMKNLLNSTEIATLFLDDDLKVRRFTTQATNIVKLIPGDVGRPITDLVTVLTYPNLASDTRDVLRTLNFHEVEASTNDGRWFTVRIMPYRTQENRIDGVAITFIDISATKTMELTLREALTALKGQRPDRTTAPISTAAPKQNPPKKIRSRST